MSSIPKIYLNKSFIQNEKVIIDGDNFHHLKNVLRLSIGDKIIVSDMENNDYTCRIINVNNIIWAEIIDHKISETEFPFSVCLFQAFAKGDKMETIVQKATELGVTDIYPVYMDRCVSKPDEKSINNKINRYQKIALNASSQSGRGKIPKVHDPIKYIEAVKKLSNYDIGFICYEGENTTPIKEILSSKKSELKSIGFLIGPEGGISEKECIMSLENNVGLVGLGKRILRTETASSFVLSAISVIFC